MSALVGYGSSDDEEAIDGEISETSKQAEAPSAITYISYPATSNGVSAVSDTAPSPSSETPLVHEPTQGPSLGHSAPGAGSTLSSAPASPYTNIRSTIQQLTLPTYPNLSIPPSPPGSPPPGLDAKISHFLSLKRQGIHFNVKLAANSALKNPSLLQKMMQSAGLDDAQDQYATTLPSDLWDPLGYTEAFYKEGLAKSQQEVARRMETKRPGTEREFVPGTAEKVEVGVGMRGGGVGSAAERVMAGLDRRGGRDGERDVKRRKG